ncbi:toxin-antitoxin system YwqK family antitoxin [Aquimarina hainanensis]|uniref:Toxin-antitoxin system YwqK family antitoxin n=1 Tax=Aquimarina hainanensis TaxID=1578017 RepID=A0ABW5NAW6_9FLAO|nr:hypothetical protein [Aquimarina sp. TRL1]QKX03431.1 hypothetical protein HN014_00355 [Aquimarina sp. TRL1]
MKYNFIFFVFIMIPLVSLAQKYNAYDQEGKRHGKWLKKYENSDQIRYEGTFEHGREVGEFKFYKPTSGNKPTAIKVFSKENDTVKVSYFTSTGNVISKGGMIGKKRVGVWKYYHKNSTKIMMTEVYKNGKLNGKQLTYFLNGQLTEKTNYVEGKIEGIRIVYAEDGTKLKEYTYEKDQLHGSTKYYDAEGKISIEGNYKRDKKDGIWNYYKDGKLSEQKLFPVKNRGM